MTVSSTQLVNLGILSDSDSFYNKYIEKLNI